MRSFPDTVIEPCSLGSSSYKFISTRTKMSFFLDLYNLPDITLQNFSPPIVFQPHQRYDFHLLPPFAVCLFFFFPRLATAPYSFGYDFLFSRVLTTGACFSALGNCSLYLWQRLLVFPRFGNGCLFFRVLATVAFFPRTLTRVTCFPSVKYYFSFQISVCGRG